MKLLYVVGMLWIMNHYSHKSLSFQKIYDVWSFVGELFHLKVPFKHAMYHGWYIVVHCGLKWMKKALWLNRGVSGSICSPGWAGCC